MFRQLFVYSYLLLVLVLVYHSTLADFNCTVGNCGWMAECDNGTCKCSNNTIFTLHKNGRDCQKNSSLCPMGKLNCLDCDANNVCVRCTNFLEETRRVCLDTCNGEAKLINEGPIQGTICKETVSNKLSLEVIIGIIAGVSFLFLVCLITFVAFCVHIRRTRRNVNLNQTHYTTDNMQVGNVKKVPMYDNQGFDIDNEPSLVNNMVDREVYLREIQLLLPHAQTLLTMLNDIRHKLRAMDKSDPRVPTYKGVVHQLCRVLVIIHRKDPAVSIAADALGLMQWAHQMIEDKLLDVDATADDSIETSPVTKISYVEVPSTQSNLYATPVIKQPNPYATLSKRNSTLNNSNVSYYSSVAVPVDVTSEANSNNLISVSQASTLVKTSKESLKRQYEIPWDLKRDNIVDLNCSGSDLTMGYFMNGRFYDPSPRQPREKPKPDPKQSVYAPASSYSDRTNPPVFSTFAGGIPRNMSFSSQQSKSSNTSSQTDDEEPFPFDIKDATEPVEV